MRVRQQCSASKSARRTFRQADTDCLLLAELAGDGARRHKHHVDPETLDLHAESLSQAVQCRFACVVDAGPRCRDIPCGKDEMLQLEY